LSTHAAVFGKLSSVPDMYSLSICNGMYTKVDLQPPKICTHFSLSRTGS